MSDLMLHKVESELSFRRVDIALELSLLASQENCDGHEYDMMMVASDHIKQLRAEIQRLNSRIASLVN